MSYDGDMRKVMSEAKDQGWTVRTTERGHYQFLAPNKRDIVVTSGTPGGGRHWQNFMADMRRAGFQTEDERGGPATTSLGDAIAQAAREESERARLHVAHEAAAAGHPKPSVGPTIAATIMDVLRDRGEAGASFDELALIASARRQAAGGEPVKRGTVTMTMTHLKGRGMVENVTRGRWRESEKERRRRQPARDAPATTGAAGRPTGPSAGEDASEAAGQRAEDAHAPPTGGATGDPPPEQAAGASVLDDDGIDDKDIEAIDRLVQALAEVEGVVRRNREFILKRRELRRVLGALMKLGGV